MATQTFFYETSHANFGLMFTDADEHIIADLVADIQAQAKALDQSNDNIYKVVAQFSLNEDGFQIFVAPYSRYTYIAGMLLETFKATSKAYIKDKNGKTRQIRKKEFTESLNSIVRNYGSNHKLAISKTVALIKDHYEKDWTSLNRSVERIASEHDMGVVKHQEYYAGLAYTWLEPLSQTTCPA